LAKDATKVNVLIIDKQMKHSLSFYLTLFIIKLKGIKKNFSTDPIDLKKIRAEDIHAPKGMFFNSKNVKQFQISDTVITEIQQSGTANKLLIFVHGGAFVSGPTQLHWDAIKEMHKATNHTIWMCDYPKAPENKIPEISNNMDSVYRMALERYEAKSIILVGDSVGGTLITALTQQLIKNKIETPKKLILICPVFDATFSNPEISMLDKTDAILSKAGALSAKKMCAGHVDLSNEMISPLYGSFEGFPTTILFLASNDITYPDQQLAVQKLTLCSADYKTIIGEGMPHIWPYLPVMREAKAALNDIISHINN
jgi:acetyl esterase/lipase